MYGQPKGYDSVRQYVMGSKNIKLQYFEEAFTSENWIVRIYKRKERHNREGVRYQSKLTNSYAMTAKVNEMLSENKYSVKVQKKRRSL